MKTSFSLEMLYECSESDSCPCKTHFVARNLEKLYLPTSDKSMRWLTLKSGLCTIHFTESQNLLSWKDPAKITKSNSWPCTGTSPRVTLRAWEHYPNASWTLPAVVQWPLPWRACSSAQTSSEWKILFLMPNLNHPWHNFMLFPQVLSLPTREERSCVYF